MTSNYTTVPYVADIFQLEQDLELQFGQDFGELTNLLFGCEYHNYSAKKFNLEDEVYEGYSWQWEDDISRRNLVRAYLRDIFPGHKYVFIDVSW